MMSESATPYLQSSSIITTKIIPESFIDYSSLQQNEIITPSISINMSPIQSELFSSGSVEYSDMHLQSSLSEENNQIIYMCSDNLNVNINNKMNVFSPKYDKDPVYPLNVECYLQVKSSRGKVSFNKFYFLISKQYTFKITIVSILYSIMKLIRRIY